MTPVDAARADSWLPEIADALLPDAKWRDEGGERRCLNQGGLTVNARKHVWFSHSAGKGGHALELVQFVKQCTREEATRCVAAWLLAHKGVGSGGDGSDSEDADIENANLAKQIIDRLTDATGTSAATYLHSRGLTGPLPACVRFLADARLGECAIAGLLTSHGRTVGVQLTYLDPDGRKSIILPSRRRFMLERAPDAVFAIASPAAGVTDLLADTLICEGLEDALSLVELGRQAGIIGLPGIGALRQLTVKRGERIVVVRDGDEPDSPADKSLIAGTDALLLQGATVTVTATPPGEDANAILQRGGAEALAKLLADTYPAELSTVGEITRLSRLDRVDYDRERESVAEKLGIRRSTLDHEVNKRRRPAETDIATDPDIDAVELLDEPVELKDVLDEILAEFRRYIVADDTALATVAVWCAHTHLCHHDRIRLQRSPRLAIQARTPGAGKTTLLEAVGALVPRPRIAASVTASSVLRVVDHLHPTLLIDEADRVLHDQNSDLLAILNAGDRRATAYVERSVPTPDGGWKAQRFSVWGSVAFAGIDELPPTQQDRSLVIQLQKALYRDIPDHLEDGMSAELMLLKRKLATWAHALEDLSRPTLPDILTRQAGRAGDNWRVQFAIAQLAGGRWPDLIEQAALEAVKREVQLTVVQRLLESIWRVFERRKTDAAIQKADDRTRIPTPDLLAALVADEQEEWATANRGRAVTDYWLRGNLRHLLTPPGSQQWEGPARGQKRGKHCRGYVKEQFEKAWERHLPTSFFANAFEPSGVSGVSGESQQFQSDQGAQASGGAGSIRCSNDGNPTPDATTYTRSANGKNRDIPASPPDPPDTPDPLDGPDKREVAPVSNGEEPTHGGRRPLSQLDSDIVSHAKAHPKLTVETIAKHFGQPPRVVRELLGSTTR